MLTSLFTYDFGYSWPYTYGHLLVFCVAAVATAIALWRHWTAAAVLSGLVALWGLAGAFVMLSTIQLNQPLRMPTEAFAPAGRVLDLGAGSGRATVGLLLARPAVTVTALDIYQGYWGIEGNTPDRLRANAKAAGVDGRVTVETGDMRKQPFEADSFDAAMSVAAMDHLSWPDIAQSLQETARVVKPGGQLLLVSLNSDWRVRLAIPAAIHGHGYWGGSQNVERWRSALDRAGFDLGEIGTRPATLYMVATAR
jgi:arsenite methyltransferase